MAECDELSNSNMSGLPVNDAQSELAKQAWQEFNKQQYDNCINILNKLLVNRSKDSKVIHNKAVAEFYQSKFTKVSEFKQSLASVCHHVSCFCFNFMHYFLIDIENENLCVVHNKDFIFM